MTINQYGFVGLYDINEKNGTCNLGIYIGEKDYWGHGYAKEAYLLIEDYAKKLNLRKIKLDVVSENIVAVSMYKKLKFYECGCYKKDRFINNKYMDVIIMEKFIQE